MSTLLKSDLTLFSGWLIDHGFRLMNTYGKVQNEMFRAYRKDRSHPLIVYYRHSGDYYTVMDRDAPILTEFQEAKTLAAIRPATASDDIPPWEDPPETPINEGTSESSTQNQVRTIVIHLLELLQSAQSDEVRQEATLLLQRFRSM